MADMSTTIGGVRLLTPFGVSSLSPVHWSYPAGPLQRQIDWHKRCVEAGAGFVYLPSTDPRVRDQTPIRMNHISQWASVGVHKKDAGYAVAASNSCTMAREPSRRLLDALKKNLPPEIKIVGSILVPSGEAEVFAQIARELESGGADLLEINAGCPLDIMEKPGVAPEPGAKFGLMLGCSPNYLEPVVKATVESVKIPVGVKTTPQAGFPGLLIASEVCIRAGAKYLLTSHVPLIVGPFDIWNGGKPFFPLLRHVNANAVSAYGGGEAVRLIDHYHTACVSMFFPQTDVWSGGGIVTSNHLVESIMLGAKAVQTASGVIFHGISQIRRAISFLESYMEKCEYKSIEDFRGLALKYVKPFEGAMQEAKSIALVSEVDPAKCVGCGTCAESICPSISMENGLAKVRQDDCIACGLCMVICQEEAINMLPSKRTLGERIDMGKDYSIP